MPTPRLIYLFPFFLALAACPSALPDRPVENNACGGTATLEGEVGEPCCLSGELVCSGVDALICVNPNGGTAHNECGGCRELAAPDCAGCRTPICADEDTLGCSEDRADDPCGECGRYVCSARTQRFECVPAETLGTACGVCNAGHNVCEGGQIVCRQFEGMSGSEVPGQTPCGYCNSGIVQCSESGPICAGGQTKTEADTSCVCGEARCMPDGNVVCARSPQSCGPCRGYACDQTDCPIDRTGEACEDCGSIACSGDEEEDAWACSASPNVGRDCGECQGFRGTWQCLEDGLVCDGGVNDCGGCELLEGSPHEECGCGGILACDGDNALACVGESRNRCGGCSIEIDMLLEEGICGACGQGRLACDGPAALVCTDPDRGVNDCGGCGELAGVPGEPCGDCARWTCADEGGLDCVELGRNSCGQCLDAEMAPATPCGLCNQGVTVCGQDGEIACDETGIRKPGDLCEGGYLDCVQGALVCESAPPGWVPIPAGAYCMGTPASRSCRNQDFGEFDTEQPVPTVQTHPYFMMTHELTRAQWREYEPDATFSSCACGDEGCDDSQCPADHMTWFAALDYANWRSRADGLTECYPADVESWAQNPPTGSAAGRAIETVITGLDLRCDGYRLPTEAEWEYAARAGTTTRSPIPGELVDCGNVGGTAEPILDPVAWWAATSNSGRVAPVGVKQANAWGLHDVLGNVTEMVMAQQYAFSSENVAVFDRVWRERYAGSRNTLVRGGSSSMYARQVGLGTKVAQNVHTQTERAGFRLVRTLPTAPAMRLEHHWTIPRCQ